MVTVTATVMVAGTVKVVWVARIRSPTWLRNDFQFTLQQKPKVLLPCSVLHDGDIATATATVAVTAKAVIVARVLHHEGFSMVVRPLISVAV